MKTDVVLCVFLGSSIFLILVITKQALQMIDCFKSFLQLDLSGLKLETVFKSRVTMLTALLIMLMMMLIIMFMMLMMKVMLIVLITLSRRMRMMMNMILEDPEVPLYPQTA